MRRMNDWFFTDEWAECHLNALLAEEGLAVDRSRLYTVFDALQIEQTREKVIYTFMLIQTVIASSTTSDILSIRLPVPH